MPTVTGTTNPELFPAFYDKKLLSYVKANLVTLQFAQRRSLKKNSGRQITFTRFEPLPANTTPITFQPTPSTGKAIATQQITATVDEYGDYIDLDEFTDITSYVPLLSETTDLLAYQARLTLDTLCMNEIANGTNVLYAGGKASADALLSTDVLTKDDIRKAVNILKNANIPPMPDGFYVCLIHPDKLDNLFTSSELIQLSVASKDSFEKGVVARFGGVKFIDTTLMPTFINAAATPITVYKTVIFGQNAYGIVDIDGQSVTMTYTNLDKLNRVKTVGWKAYFVAKRLYEDALIRIESA
ncbi:N4-gp56 family major capsid protein [Deferribacter autotrophicus]|uniref:N4-gp56 family major capsid protein n=1 Tax=Deferribacter autotrophicus TaxID=500465 RepID=A0A5A8F2T8_9BACT|nr:N4-gp56 family major capsid protein [Deferribacter autotrophicus]KAA0257205.1 N4-gp56 family major capsid protein [Deferribacter autotrophicus]